MRGLAIALSGLVLLSSGCGFEDAGTPSAPPTTALTRPGTVATTTRPPATTVGAEPATSSPPSTRPPAPSTSAPTTTEPATTPTSSPGVASVAVLRRDGLGPFVFGAPADEVEAWLAGELGEPDTAIVEGFGGWPLESCNERRFSYWASAGFVVGYTDLVGYDSDTGVARCDDTPHLEAWYVTHPAQPWFSPDHTEGSTTEIQLRLVTEDGIGLRSTAGELRQAEPTVEFGQWDIDTYVAEAFRSPSGLGGRFDWDPIADLQRALNDWGADLGVDGTLGPRTSDALSEFQSSHGIDESGIGPATLEALGVDVPDEAPIVYLRAGAWDFDY